MYTGTSYQIGVLRLRTSTECKIWDSYKKTTGYPIINKLYDNATNNYYINYQPSFEKVSVLILIFLILVISVSRQSGTVGWLGNFWPEGAFLNVLKPPLRLGRGNSYQLGPARYLEGSLRRRIRDPASLRPAQLIQTRTATHSMFLRCSRVISCS